MSSRRGIRLRVSAVAASVVAVVFASLFLVAQPVQASSDDEVMKKALAGAMEMCYRNRGSAFKSPIDTSEYFSIDSAVNAVGSYYMPTNIGNSMGTTPINCKEVFLGVQGGFLNTSTKLQGILARFGKSDYGVTPENLGYVDDTSGSASSQGYSCFNVSYHLFSSASDFTNKTSNKVCFPTDSSGKINIDNPQNVKLEDEGNVTSELGSLKIEYDSSMDCIRYSAMNPPAGESWGQGTGYGCFAWGVDGKTPSEVVQAMNEGASNIVANKGMIMTEGFFSVYQANEPAHTPTASQSTSQGSLASSMVLNNDSSRHAMDWLKGGTDGYTGMTFGPDDWAYIYTTYIKRLRESGQISVNNDCTTDKNKYTYAVTSDNGTTWCEVLGAESVTEQFAGQSGNSNKVLELMPFTKILEKYKNLNFANVDSGTTGGVVGGDDDPGSEGSGEDGDAGLVDGCFNNSGALGWIICPVLRMAGAATTGIYQSIADNYLTVKSETMTSEALRGVWSDFQGYANILFAILLIIVILSQVTGVGLSNYGIKKVLPRLIITIILVNLSFILCSVAVDLSNILGTSLNDLFMNWNVGGYVAENLNIGTMIGNTIESLFSVGAGTAITVVGIKVAIATGAWEGIILSLLLTVLVAFISIIFFYVILGVRQAAIVILIAVAPVAIVCYALPNTQKVFDRWLKIFSSLLLVFPICGLLMGGSNFASRLLLAANGEVGFMYFLVAMLLSVIPLFFVPTVLKSSMAAMGNIGTKISNMGSRFGNWSNRTVRGTRAFQERQQEAMRNSNMTRNQKIMDKTKLSDAQQTRLAALRAKRASGATLTNNERRELRELGSRQYRYARAASARERGVMEDAMADVASRREMLEHGSARYEKIVAGAMREQRNRDDAGQIALYEDGKVDAFGGGGKVRGDSLDDLAKEHAALLAHVADNPEDEIAASKLRAVQTLLGKMGPNGFDKMEDNFGNLMANHGQFSSANSKGLGIATSHLSRNFAGQIKANSRTFDKMLTDFNSDRFSQQGTFAQQTFTDALGKTQTKYMSSYYGAQGAQSIKAENVNDLGDTYYDNLLRATITGDLQGKDLEQVLNVFNEAEAAAAAGKLTLKGEVRQRIQAIKNAAYASSALNGGVRSEGSRMIGAAGTAGIDSIVKQIESAGDWSTMSTAERKQYSDLVNNITDSLKKDAHTVEDVRQLQQALATARGKNIETAVTGGNLISQVGTADLHSYKIPRGSKQKVTMPTGWTKTTSGTWIDIATGAPLNMTDAAKAEKILEHNASIDVENDA